MSVIRYYLTNLVDIAGNITLLTDRINNDPQINSTLVSIVYSAPDIVITFNSTLDERSNYIVFTMYNAIFNNMIAGVDYTYNNNVIEPRNISALASNIPDTIYDIYAGYNAGSTVNTTTGDIYVCTDATANNAEWTALYPTPTFMAYATGNTTVASSPSYTDIPFNVQNRTNTNYTHTLGNTDITINTTGYYKVSVDISTQIGNGSTQRTISRGRVAINGTAVPGSETYMYNRGTGGAINLSQNTGSIQMVILITAGDVLTVQVQKYAGGAASSIETIANAVRVLIQKN